MGIALARAKQPARPRTFAASDPSEPLVLAPGRIWWKAEIAKERAAALAVTVIALKPFWARE